MRAVIKKNYEKAKESTLHKILFDHPIIKFISFIVIQIVLTAVIQQLPSYRSLKVMLVGIGILIAIYFVIVIVHVIRQSIKKLLNPASFPSLIGAYILFIISLLFILSTVFNIVELSKMGYITYGSCQDKFTPEMIASDSRASHDYFYFTSVTFFTLGYGDICPMGYAKILSIFTAFIGHLVSVIIVTLVINNYLQMRENSASEWKPNKQLAR